MIEKRCALVDLITYQDGEWLIWPKQCHSLAALPPSSGHTVVACFRPKRAKNSCFYANRLERQNGFLAESAKRATPQGPKRATPQGQCRASRARTNDSDGSARRSDARLRRLVCLSDHGTAANRRHGRRNLPGAKR